MLCVSSPTHYCRLPMYQQVISHCSVSTSSLVLLSCNQIATHIADVELLTQSSHGYASNSLFLSLYPRCNSKVVLQVKDPCAECVQLDITLFPIVCAWCDLSSAPAPPLYSGNTLHVPELLKYSCRLETNLRLTSAALTHTFCEPALAAEISSSESSKAGKKGKAGKQPVLHVHHSDRELLGAVFGGRPLLAMAFDNMVVSDTVRDRRQHGARRHLNLVVRSRCLNSAMGHCVTSILLW